MCAVFLCARPVRLVVFDFDRTLAARHVFKSLAGWHEEACIDIQPPFARTELGQLMRLAELDEDAAFREQGGFATVAFGGRERIGLIRQLLQDLRQRGIGLVICSKGLVGPIRRLLSDIDSLQYFSAVYGNIGNLYGTNHYDTLFDVTTAGPEYTHFLGTATEVFNGRTKGDIIQRLMQQQGFSWSQVLLVDDDPEQIQAAKGVCRTFLVGGSAGIDVKQANALRAMVAEQGWLDECCLKWFCRR